MELKYAHLCDYADMGARGKPNVIGIFDAVLADARRPIVLPPVSVLVALTAHVTEGTEHIAEIRLTDDQGHDVIPRSTLPFRFQPSGPDRVMMKAFLILRVERLELADTGDYEFYFLVGGNSVASVPLVVAPAPQPK